MRKGYWARYAQIERMKAEQLRGLHTREVYLGRYLVPYEIGICAGLPELTVSEQRKDALENWCVEHLRDDADEAPECQAQAWYATRPHAAQTLGMLHSADWLVVKRGLDLAVKIRPKITEVEAVQNTLV